MMLRTLKISLLFLFTSDLFGLGSCILQLENTGNYMKTIPENAAVGTFITQLKCIDCIGRSLNFTISHSQFTVSYNNEEDVNVTLNQEFDRLDGKENSDELIKVTVNDTNLNDSVTVSFLVRIKDVNDNAPQFKRIEAVQLIEIHENNKSSNENWTFTASDRDFYCGTQTIQFKLLDSSGNQISNIFTVERNLITEQDKIRYAEGMFKLEQPLDYEENSFYSLTLRATDNSQSDGSKVVKDDVQNAVDLTVNVKVIDEDDTEPLFTEFPLVVHLLENSPKGYFVFSVKAIDGDRGINNNIVYSLKEVHDTFELDKKLGKVTVKTPPDREKIESHLVTITATEVSEMKKSTDINITVIIDDINDNPPVIAKAKYTGSLDEHSIENYVVNIEDSIEIEDIDQAENAKFTVSLEGDEQKLFKIVPSKGQSKGSFTLKVNNSEALDFGALSKNGGNVLKIKIIAVDDKDPTLRSSSTIIITVNDINDNFPQFVNVNNNVSIDENSDIGTLVTTIEAIDEDSGDFGTNGIEFLLTTFMSVQDSQPFRIDKKSGKITVADKNALDRETIPRFTLMIEAADNNGEGNKNFTQIIVHLNDLNDNAPEFIQPTYSAILTENSNEFQYPLSVKATDKDEGLNAEVLYKIKTGAEHFHIDSTSGTIRVAKPLDYEVECKTSVTGRCDVQLTIVAYDRGIPSQETEMNVTITLEDENDNMPEFSESQISITINETTELGTKVLTVTAVDKDITQRFRTIYYQIRNGSLGLFSIGVSNGDITVTGNITLLQTKNKTEFELEVIAIDGGNHGYDSNCTVLINIIDVNNEPPVFITSEYQNFSIYENETVTSKLTTIIATDPDTNYQLKYSLDWTNSKAYFEGRRKPISECEDWLKINPDTGEITVNSKMDRETIDEIQLKIIVEDTMTEIGFASSASMTITVNILDVNDNAPEFLNLPYDGKVTENEKINFTISPQIVATDKDLNQIVTFRICDDSNFTNLIRVDNEDGTVFVNGLIDREETAELNFTVEAMDNGDPPLRNSTFYYIKVYDVNDNNPQFSEISYEATISENDNTSVIQIIATDKDEGEYGKIRFFLESGNNNFTIDPTTGLITTKAPLDRENIEVRDTNTMVLKVKARDNPDQPYDYLTNDTQVTITILDENDNSPIIKKFEDKGCFKEIYENEVIGKVIGALEATDDDQPNTVNSTIEFSNNSTNEVKGLFSISTNGNISIASNLTGKIDNFNLTAIAKDLGSPPMISDPVDFLICVLDFNDHIPYITSPSNGACISVNIKSLKDDTVLEVKAEDGDTGLNGEIVFKMTSSNNKFFTLDEKTGILSKTEQLKGSEKSFHKITLYVEDKGTVPHKQKSDEIVFYIVINPEEQAKPEFRDKISKITFTEEQTNETQLFPEAVDPDAQVLQNVTSSLEEINYCRDNFNNSNLILQPICYFIVGNNQDGYFSLNKTTREISLLKPLDRETQATHRFYVLATKDCDLSPIPELGLDKDISEMGKSYITIDVDVNDINDNLPEFTKNFTGGVTSESQIGDVIVFLEFTDADEGKNNESTFSIISVTAVGKELDVVKNNEDIFKMSDDGKIILNYRFAETMKGYFEIPVTVKNKEEIIPNDRTKLNQEKDKATVKIYVVATDQMLELVLRIPHDEFLKRIQNFIETMNMVTDSNITIHTSRNHIESGKVDPDKTTVKVFGIRNGYEVVDPKELQDKIDIDYVKLKNFNILTAKVTQDPEQKENDYKLLIGIAGTGFIAILFAILSSIYCMKSSKLQRQLKAATATSFGSHEDGLNKAGEEFPTTNLFAIQGSNPLYNDDPDIKMDVPDDDISETSLEKIDNVTDFEGGINNGGFSAMIEGLFDDIGKESSLNEQKMNQINENFIMKKPEKLSATEL